jgi:DNA polymerase-3 subunit gamma/tau
MSYQVIARKYRPSSFSEVISQEHVRSTLQNAIRLRRIAHGYILSGQRGTGKTTVARIIARCLNCINGPTVEPCGDCASCREITAGGSVDVIEIDAASNRGINEMRELRENVRYRPARDRYKVFIVDEAHQITTEAFNALLKTLEEPPEWVVFILCTTESHKIPVTIASRCQQFSFRSVDYDELVNRMRWICEQEGIHTDEEALGILAHVGEGSVRDSLSALDQAIACCGNTLNATDLRSLMGLFSVQSLQEVADALSEGNAQRMLEIVQELERNGRSLHHFCRELSRYFRNLLVARVSGSETKLIAASTAEQARMRETAARFSEEDLTRYLHLSLELFKDMQQSLQPRLHLEVGLLRLVQAGKLLPIEQALSAIKGDAPMPRASAPPTRTAAPPAARTGPSPFALDAARKTTPAPAPVPASTPKASSSSGGTATALAVAPGDVKSAMFQALNDLGCDFTADAVQVSDVIESGDELAFVTPAEFRLGMSESDLRKAALQVFGKPYRIKVTTASAMAKAAPVEADRPAATPSRSVADVKSALFQALTDMGCNFTADAVEASEVTQADSELSFLTPIEFKLAMSESDIRKASAQVLGKPYKIRITVGTPVNAAPVAAKSAPAEDELMTRAMADPAVQIFREVFPSAEIRQVRNLKEEDRS